MLAVEGTILLSNIIKSNFSNISDQKNCVISLKTLPSKEKDFSEMDKSSLQEVASKLMEDASQKAEEIINQAQLQYEETQLLIQSEQNNWNSQKEHLIKEAQKEGFENGYNQGKTNAIEQYTELIKEAQVIVEAARQDYLEYIESAEEVIFSLGMKVAEKIIGHEIKQNDNAFLSIVRNAIKEVRNHSEISIFVHPTFYELLVSSKSELQSLMNQSVDLFIYPNIELSETSCVIESSFGRVDASVDSQLEEIKEKLLAILVEE